MTTTLDKLNTEADNYLFRDYEIVPVTVSDGDLPPQEICKKIPLTLVNMMAASRSKESINKANNIESNVPL